MTSGTGITRGSRVAVLGLGVSGRSAVRYALECGAEVMVSDMRQANQFETEEREFLERTGINWEAGRHTLQFLSKADLVLASPGVDLQDPLITELRGAGVKISGELGVVADRLDIPVVAVTGTNGKTTVTTLIGEILKKSGKKVFVGGNIGTPLYNYFTQKEKHDLIVVELSSFQLETAGTFAPNVGVLLNITPDHLDRHRTMEHYIDAKMQLFRNQSESDVAVVNGDDLNCRNMDPDFRAVITSFGTGSYNDLVIEDGRLRINKTGDREEYEFGAEVALSGFQAKNFAAAVLALRAVGCSQKQIIQGVEEFCPPPHRLEFVTEKAGVRFYDDSKATNTGAVVGALCNLDSPVILIAGGRDKGDDYGLLAKSVKEKVKQLVLIGEAAEKIEEALGGIVEIIRAESMEEAVNAAATVACPGDSVLLSPACASFDMFRSYSHRGEVFKGAVRQYCEHAGDGVVKA